MTTGRDFHSAVCWLGTAIWVAMWLALGAEIGAALGWIIGQTERGAWAGLLLQGIILAWLLRPLAQNVR
ncbi:hypothetical protein [Paracoccus laeviglucosivorans]|uniref:Uncharacterized protein n=1 Tax=Paracoccus laeviglucosivorans TaxID=1197861 RepID=A0A521FBI6_9RHOB|nr:hypothetical protein [Paracoccus laeviglucosivorans]SMO93001.1 hypothetical protein SAMN06265221_11941 [Paracoccus laeviglucosivorans]